MPILKIPSGSIYYEIHGQGLPLVCIHGAWSSHKWWKYQVTFLSQKYQVLTYDLRGHGQSLSLTNNYDLPSLVADLKFLLQKIGIDETVLMGWSLGGMLSLEYCLCHPQTIKALILISTRAQRQPIWKKKIWLSLLRARLNLMINLAAPRKFNFREASFPEEKRLLDEELKKMSSASIHPETYEWLKTDFQSFNANSYWSIAQNLWHWEISHEKLKTIAIPTLILAGEQDRLTPLSFAQSLQRTLPNSRLVIIREGGHLLPLEHPHQVNTYIAEFLQEINY